MVELALKVEDIKKKYRLGIIGGGTLCGDLQSWWAKIRGKEDPPYSVLHMGKPRRKPDACLAAGKVNKA